MNRTLLFISIIFCTGCAPLKGLYVTDLGKVELHWKFKPKLLNKKRGTLYSKGYHLDKVIQEKFSYEVKGNNLLIKEKKTHHVLMNKFNLKICKDGFELSTPNSLLIERHVIRQSLLKEI